MPLIRHVQGLPVVTEKNPRRIKLYFLASKMTKEVVYVGAINTEHHRLCTLFLGAGKHVLCEKPMNLTLAGCEDILRLARDKQLFFMEAAWFRFFPVYDQIRKELSAGSLGDIRLVQANMSFPCYHVERVANKALGGGGLKDLGTYALVATALVFKERPIKITAQADVTEKGTDATGGIILQYPGGGMASLSYTTMAKMDGNMSIQGTKGTIQVDRFWAPTKVRTPSGEFKWPLPVNDYEFIFYNTAGLIYEQNAVRECLKKGLLECPLMTHDDSRTVAYIADEILKQYGIKYDYP